MYLLENLAISDERIYLCSIAGAALQIKVGNLYWHVTNF